MFYPGDVIAFYSDEAGKRKYHVCININGTYLFLNSPKKKTYPTDFIFPCSEMPFIPPTESGQSIISCSLPMIKKDAELKRLKAIKIGQLPNALFIRLIRYIEDSPSISEEQKEYLLDGLGDWF